MTRTTPATLFAALLLVAATAHPSAGLRLAPRLVATPNVAVLGAGGQF